MELNTIKQFIDSKRNQLWVVALGAVVIGLAVITIGAATNSNTTRFIGATVVVTAALGASLLTPEDPADA